MAFGLNHLLIYQNDATPIFLWDIYGGFGYEILMVIFSSNFQNDVHPDNIKKNMIQRNSNLKFFYKNSTFTLIIDKFLRSNMPCQKLQYRCTVLPGKEGKNFNREKIKFVSLPQLFLSNFSPLLIQLQEDQKGLAQS